MRRCKNGAFLMAAWLAVFCWCVGCSEDSSSVMTATNPPMLIEPKVAVGKVRAGMGIPEVVAQLGEPQRRTANALEYTKMGFAVMPATDGTIRVVMCGDVTGLNGPLVKAFTGRTREGIGLTSTRDDLLKAYGPPNSDEKLIGGAESMRYDLLGMTFTLEGGKVYHMIVRLGSNEPPDRSVTLEPAPPSEQKQP